MHITIVILEKETNSVSKNDNVGNVIVIQLLHEQHR